MAALVDEISCGVVWVYLTYLQHLNQTEVSGAA